MSWTTISVIRPAIVAFLSAWNSHRIPGVCGGIPNTLVSQAFEVTQLPGVVIPTTAEAICLHRDQGGTLTEEHGYGTDPLTGFQGLQQLRERDFYQRYPDMEVIFQNVLHHDGSLFRMAILYFISLTTLFSELVN